MAAPIENKAVAAPAATLVIGYLTGVLIEVVPWLKTNLTADQQETLPIILAFAASLIAAYFAPHTDRPDLGETVALAPLRPYLTTEDPGRAEQVLGARPDPRGGAGVPPDPGAVPPHQGRL